MTHVAPIRVLEDSIALGRLHLTALGRLTALIGDQEGTQLSAPAGHALVAGVCRVTGCRRAGRMGEHSEFHSPLSTSTLGVLKAVPLPSRRLLLRASESAYVRFTPSNSEQR